MKKLISLTALAVMLAGTTFANGLYSYRGTNTDFRTGRAAIDSGTTVVNYDIGDVSANLTVYISATAAVSYTVDATLTDGTKLYTVATGTANTTPVSVSVPGPVPFQSLKVSPTTAQTAANAMHVIATESK